MNPEKARDRINQLQGKTLYFPSEDLTIHVAYAGYTVNYGFYIKDKSDYKHRYLDTLVLQGMFEVVSN